MSTTEVPEVVHWSLPRNYLQYLAWLKLGVNTKFVLGLSEDKQRIFEQHKKSPKKGDQLFIYNYKQRVAVGDMTNWHTLMVQMHLLCQWSGYYIQDVT